MSVERVNMSNVHRNWLQSTYWKMIILVALCGLNKFALLIHFYVRFLQSAEMLKPSTPSASHDSSGSSGSDDGTEYYPHIGDCSLQKHSVRNQSNLQMFPNFSSWPVFLQNKARREDFCPRNLKNMHMVVDKLMAHSHLKYKGAYLKTSLMSTNQF